MKNEKEIQTRHRHELELQPLHNSGLFPPHFAVVEDFVRSAERGDLGPIEITPDNVVVDGPAKLAAAEQLGYDTVEVWVNTDLIDDLQIAKRVIQLHTFGEERTNLIRLVEQLYAAKEDGTLDGLHALVQHVRGVEMEDDSDWELWDVGYGYEKAEDPTPSSNQEIADG